MTLKGSSFRTYTIFRMSMARLLKALAFPAARESHNDLKKNLQLPEVDSKLIWSNFTYQTTLHKVFGRFNIIKDTQEGLLLIFCNDLDKFKEKFQQAFLENELETRHWNKNGKIVYRTFEDIFADHAAYISTKQGNYTFVLHIRPQDGSHIINRFLDYKIPAEFLHKTRHLKCAGCEKIGQEFARRKCGGCQRVYYCSKECQKSDWAAHKPNCKMFQLAEKIRDLSLGASFPNQV